MGEAGIPIPFFEIAGIVDFINYESAMFLLKLKMLSYLISASMA
jgi:hypothetical protein